ncbi:MAG TPA: hypothetical protein VNZ03_15485 [Terriglobales bacterium]|jgi:hypothetical protein|nr:hypothetical protein [Terriglobales bacterium]
MRDSYVADVGDFGKYALLNALAGDDLRLGVVWCRNSEPDATQDGRFTEYPELRACDPDLYDRLAQMLKADQRSLAHVENNHLLPSNTLFYGTAMPAPKTPCFSAAAREAQTRLRSEWLNDGLKKLVGAELVFLDPDNGMAARAKKHWRSSVKYVFADEVAEWLKRGQSVVLYQHQQHRKLVEQVAEQQKILAAETACHAVSFHRRTARIYYILPTEDHKSRIAERLTLFLAGEWGKHFRAC